MEGAGDPSCVIVYFGGFKIPVKCPDLTILLVSTPLLILTRKTVKSRSIWSRKGAIALTLTGNGFERMSLERKRFLGVSETFKDCFLSRLVYR